MRSSALLLAFLALLTACASEASFYSFPCRAFVLLEQVSARKDLVGTWRSNNGHQLVLRRDGQFSAGTMTGCWDVDGPKLLLRSACVNYGSQNNNVTLTLAESTDECSFNLSGRLVLRDCDYAGTYGKQLGERG
jgi:hypothetical protein